MSTFCQSLKKFFWKTASLAWSVSIILPKNQATSSDSGGRSTGLPVDRVRQGVMYASRLAVVDELDVVREHLVRCRKEHAAVDERLPLLRAVALGVLLPPLEDFLLFLLLLRLLALLGRARSGAGCTVRVLLGFGLARRLLGLDVLIVFLLLHAGLARRGSLLLLRGFVVVLVEFHSVLIALLLLDALLRGCLRLSGRLGLSRGLLLDGRVASIVVVRGLVFAVRLLLDGLLGGRGAWLADGDGRADVRLVLDAVGAPGLRKRHVVVRGLGFGRDGLALARWGLRRGRCGGERRRGGGYGGVLDALKLEGGQGRRRQRRRRGQGELSQVATRGRHAGVPAVSRRQTRFRAGAYSRCCR